MRPQGHHTEHSIHPKRLTRSPRVCVLALATLISGVLVAGCGGSSASPTAATAGGASTSASTAASSGAATTAGSTNTTGAGAMSSRSTAPGAGGSALAFAKCMRASGVPNFPDPQPGGGFFTAVGSGVNPYAPAVQAAQAKCWKLAPNVGRGPAFSEQALVRLRRVAVCMRQHRVPDFPDPKRDPWNGLPSPSNASPNKYSRIADYRGVLLEFPATLNTYSPAFEQALKVCGGAFLNQPG